MCLTHWCDELAVLGPAGVGGGFLQALPQAWPLCPPYSTPNLGGGRSSQWGPMGGTAPTQLSHCQNLAPSPNYPRGLCPSTMWGTWGKRGSPCPL